MGIVIIILIIFAIICFWRGKVILNDFPSPKMAYCYKQIAYALFAMGIISIIIAIINLITIFNGSGGE